MINLKRTSPDRLFSVWRAALYLNLEQSCLKNIYTALGIPHTRIKNRLYFFQKDLHKWVKENPGKLKPYQELSRVRSRSKGSLKL